MIKIDMKVSEDNTNLKINLKENQDNIMHLNLSNVLDQREGNDNVVNDGNQMENNKKQYIHQTNNSEKSQNKQQNKIQNNETLLTLSQKQEKPSLYTKLKKNKFLIEIFNHFCNMTYANTRKKTFQQMAKNITYMSLNRFMLFSKQFNIDHIIRVDINSRPKRQSLEQNYKLKTQPIQIKQTINVQKNQRTSPKPVMLQIPVKNINNTQKTLTKLYRKNTANYDKMTYQEFLSILIQIYQIFQRNINNLYKGQNFIDIFQKQEKYLSDVLIINEAKKFEQKMSNLKIQFKGAISYHQEPTHKSTSFLNRKLVIHGGRSPDQMRNELEIYQANKIERKQSWIDKQPQTIGMYSKSRVFYRPNPSKVYQTNDVIRLARKQAGRTQTESLFNYDSLKSQKRETMLRRQEGVNLSQIFEDKTNKFSQKLQKIKKQLSVKDQKNRKKEQVKQIDRDDEILQKYFENERKIYGDESIIMGFDKQ